MKNKELGDNRIKELEDALKQAIELHYLDRPMGMNEYEFSVIRGKEFVRISKLVDWGEKGKPFVETK